jgi:hypothetical protein
LMVIWSGLLVGAVVFEFLGGHHRIHL